MWRWGLVVVPAFLACLFNPLPLWLMVQKGMGLSLFNDHGTCNPGHRFITALTSCSLECVSNSNQCLLPSSHMESLWGIENFYPTEPATFVCGNPGESYTQNTLILNTFFSSLPPPPIPKT